MFCSSWGNFNSFYNPFMNPFMMGGCCNNMFATMFKVRMIQSIMQNIFEPRQTYFPCQQVQYRPQYQFVRPTFQYQQPKLVYDNGFDIYMQNQRENFYNNLLTQYENAFSSPITGTRLNTTGLFNDAYDSGRKAYETITSGNNSGKKITIGKNEITKLACEKAQKYGVDEKLILAIIDKESGFVNGQTSTKGAKGLMQLMPATAKELGVTDINDPEQNIDAGVRYMKKLLDMYNGDVKKALAAYNWGMGNLNKKGLANAPRETRNYVDTIYNSYQNYEVA